MRTAVAASVLVISSTVAVGSAFAWAAGVGGAPRHDLSGPAVTVSSPLITPRPGGAASPVVPRVVRAPSTNGTTPLPSDALDPIVRPDPPSTLRRMGPGVPVRIRIPSVRVDARILPVGLDPDGTMELPPAASTGWFEPGARVGADRGSAVIAGHVDQRRRPGAFIRLRDVRVGQSIEVVDDRGTTHRFTVTERFQVEKELLPMGELFRRDGPPTLTLITCGGEFRPSARRYRDNIVIRAVPAATAMAAAAPPTEPVTEPVTEPAAVSARRT